MAAKPQASAQTQTPLGATARVLRTSLRIQCAPYARKASGVALFGDARTWWTQAEGRYDRDNDPAAGDVLVMKGYRTALRGHVAVVREVISDREILIDHANWLNQGEITLRAPVRDVSAAGDWSQIQVWHIPSGQWGVRIYSVEGFIAPHAREAAAGPPPLG